MVTRHRSSRPDVAMVIALAVGVYAWVMGVLLEAFAAWIAAGGSALLRYSGFR